MSKREAIVQLHCAGRTNSEIIKLLQLAKSTVYYVVNRFTKIVTSEDRPRSGISRNVRSKKSIKLFEKG